MSLLQRLKHHLRELAKNPAPLCHAEPENMEKNLTHWIGYIDGPNETPFEGGRFHLTIDFPSDFPFNPPLMKFVTPIFHPNISSKGDICLDILHNQWSPVLTVRSLLISLCSLLSDPNAEHGLNQEALTIYRTDRNKYQEVASKWTHDYAMKR